MNLTTPFEVLKYSPAGFNYPTRMFCVLIPQIEQAFRRECLGDTLFDFLVSHLNEYPDTFTEWDATETYNLGDIVIRNACTYESAANSNTDDPLETGADWQLFDRFDHAGANTLWALYLRQIFALKVYLATIQPATYQSGAGGLVVNNGDNTGARAATKAELLTIINDQTNLLRMMVENMLEWLRDNAVANDLPSPICFDGCETRTNRSRRWAFR
jgi:hypothetical protein